ncbi:hypothetical protein PC117_g27451, partial [Phytophthora cactorum]
MVGLPPDQVKITPWFLVPRATRVRGSIQDIKDMLDVAAKGNVRPIIEKMPMSEVNKGLDKTKQRLHTAQSTPGTASLWSRLFFSYADPMMRAGNTRQ